MAVGKCLMAIHHSQMLFGYEEFRPTTKIEEKTTGINQLLVLQEGESNMFRTILYLRGEINLRGENN